MAAQGEGAIVAPVPSGLLQTCTDDGLAADSDRSGADAKALGAEWRVAHAGTVVINGVGAFAHRFASGMNAAKWPAGCRGSPARERCNG